MKVAYGRVTDSGLIASGEAIVVYGIHLYCVTDINSISLKDAAENTIAVAMTGVANAGVSFMFGKAGMTFSSGLYIEFDNAVAAGEYVTVLYKKVEDQGYPTSTSQTLTDSGVVGVSGRQTVINSVLIDSNGAGDGSITIHNGTAGTDETVLTLTGTNDKSVIKQLDVPVSLPDGCYITVVANVDKVLIQYSQI